MPYGDALKKKARMDFKKRKTLRGREHLSHPRNFHVGLPRSGIYPKQATSRAKMMTTIGL
jgi:hypothetical protein